MDVKALQLCLRDFTVARGWQTHHVPKNLAMALVAQAADLMELFQWVTLTESRSFTRDAQSKERVADEIAGVLLGLLQLADHTDVDLEQAVERKLRKRGEKYPARHPNPPPAALPSTTPRMHLLVDWENVQPTGDTLQALVPQGTDIWLFHGPQQKVDTSSHVQAFGGERIVQIPRSGAGKNALDFQLAYYVGYISARQPDASFVVVSNDTGYEPMLEHARELGFDARRCEYRKPSKLPAPAPVLPKAKAPLTPEPEMRTRPLAAAPPESTINQIVEGAWSNLRTMPIDKRPRQQPEVMDYLKRFIGHTAKDRDGLAQQAWQWLLDRGNLLPPDGPKESEYAPAQPQRAPGKALSTADAGTAHKKMPGQSAEGSPKVTRQEVQQFVQQLQSMAPARRPVHKDVLLVLLQAHLGESSPQSPRVAHALAQLRAQKHVGLKGDGVSYPTPPGDAPAPAKPATAKVAPVKAAPSRAIAKAPPKKASMPPETPKAAVPSKKTQPATAAQVALRVLASLKKMSANKPTRRAGLLKHIETHAAKAANPKAMAQQVCALLEARKDVVPSPDGKGVTYPKIEMKKASNA